jgi:pimeloyl-ACP methyl ester carboxylesterase
LRLLPGAVRAASGLTVAFLAGLSWYLAGLIRAEALTVGPAPAMPAFDDVRFVGLASGKAWLRAVGHQPGLFKAGLCGIAWSGGIGQLGAAVVASGGVVTRPLTVTSGSAPRIGQLAAIERCYFLGDPEAALGIAVRDVVVPGPLGPLPAWYFPGRGHTFVIGVHGQNGSRKDLLRVIDIVRHLGFPALAVTYRNDQDAARDPSGYHQYGQSEWTDIEAAVRWSLAHGARHVVLVGQSMGAGLVAAFLARSPLAAAVSRVVLDAPMLDLHAAVGHQVDQFLTARTSRRLFPVTRGLLAPLVRAAEWLASARFGVDWSAASYLEETAWLRVPALVTHGDADPRVPVSVSVRLQRLAPALVTLARFPDAGHLESWNTDRPRYTSLLAEFLAPLRDSQAD